MIRVLHLLDHLAEFEAERGSESLARAIGEGFVIERRTIGFGGDYRDIPTAAAAIRRSNEQFDLVHAWGGAALTVAAFATRGRIIFSLSPESHWKTIRWLRAVMTYRRVEVVSSTATLRKRLVQRGIALDRTHLIRPGVEFGRVKRRRDPELRARLGLTETDRVMLVAGESTRAAAHFDAMWAAGILHLTGEQYKLLLWGRGPMAKSVARFADNLGQRVALRVAEQQLGTRVEFEDLLPATDIVINTSRGPVSTLPICIAMAAGLPIVSTVTYTASELLEDRHTALLAPSAKPRQFARRVLDLEEDPGVQWSIADMARTEAYEFFAFTRFLNQFRSVYRQTLEQEKVELALPSAGAGLRFHGRA